MHFLRRERAALLVLLDALKSLFKLRDQRSFAGLQTVASHHAPEKIAIRPLVQHAVQRDRCFNNRSVQQFRQSAEQHPLFNRYRVSILTKHEVIGRS
jgi:hypothetical protein